MSDNDEAEFQSNGKPSGKTRIPNLVCLNLTLTLKWILSNAKSLQKLGFPSPAREEMLRKLVLNQRQTGIPLTKISFA